MKPEPPLPTGELYERLGRQTSIALRGYSTVIVVSDNPTAAAQVAIGLARSEASHRRVVVGDLIGDLEPIRATASTDDSHGIYDSFVFGTSLERVMREVPGAENFSILTSGTESPALPEILGSHRWRRIASDFAETDALLLLVASPQAPALDKLAAQVDGVLLVGDLALENVPDAVLLARIPHPQVAPETAAAEEKIVAEPWWRSRGVTLATLAVLILAFAIVMLRPGGIARRSTADTVMLPEPVRDTTPPPRKPEMVVANPADSTTATAYSVEIVSTNTQEGANFTLRGLGAMTPAATISLVPIGETEAIWYKVHAGAFGDSAQAARLLRSLRRRQIVPDTEGIVVRTPLALRVDSVPSQAAVTQRTRAKIDSFTARGVAVYALTQRDGSARLYAGAFERPEQASLAATALRVAGLTPILEYRTGRVQ
ncbi:MAG TPA: SPOR domain-containing protein [Gemmatimonadaceae bacterium]|nr:SPOR domain-containing protein [Gemmatimonadaceae bacterium]